MILGGGYAGLPAARKLEKLLPPQSAKVTLVSDVNFMLYTPLLPGAAGGTLDPRHIVVPVREELEHTEFRLGHVTGLDLERRLVHVDGSPDLPYDQLVVTLGSTSRVLPIPGLAEHGLGFKTISEAIALRNRLISTLERAELTEDPAERRALLTYVFVGAGYAGLEGIAELQDFGADVIERYPRCRMEGMRFILVEARDRVMPEINASLADFAAHELRKRGIEILTGTTLDDVQPDSVKLSTVDDRIPCHTVCWTAGVKPVPVVSHMGLPLVTGPHRGRQVLPCRRPRRRVGDRRRRRRPRPRPARRVLPADRAARAAPGPARRQERRPCARLPEAQAVHLQDARASSWTWAATRRSRRRWASAGAASRRGSSPGPTTCCRCPGSSAACGSWPTGPST